jgi:hypothetical protein
MVQAILSGLPTRQAPPDGQGSAGLGPSLLVWSPHQTVKDLLDMVQGVLSGLSTTRRSRICWTWSKPSVWPPHQTVKDLLDMVQAFCLASPPDRLPQTVKDLLDMVQAILSGLPTT